MNERRFLLILGGLILLLAWTRENLAVVHQKFVQPVQIEDSLKVIDAHGGTLDDQTEEESHIASPSMATFAALIEDGFKSGDQHILGSGTESPGHQENGHEGHDHEGHGHEEGEESTTPAVSSGLILILQHLGMAELAANLLWLQMDSDSHEGLWHRVNFYLELIPKIDPHFVEAFLLRAHILDQGFKEIDKAVELLESGIKSNPYHSELYVQLGVYAFNFHNLHGPKRNLEKALEAFSQALNFPDAPGHIPRMYALTLAATGKRQEAVEFLKRVKGVPGRSAFDLAQDNLAIHRIESGEQF